MKKTKLLTSLVLVTLLLASCSDVIDDTNIDEDSINTETTTSENISGTTSGSSESEVVSINPGELIEKAYEEGNYTITLRIYEMVSQAISKSDYNNENYDMDALMESMTTTLYTINLYYTENAVMCELLRGESTYFEGILLVNDYWTGYGEVVRAFTRYNEDADWNFKGSYYYYWQQHLYSLFYAYEQGVSADDFTIYSVGIFGSEYAELYSATTEAATTLAYSIGLDWWFSDVDSEISKMYYNGIYVMPNIETMLAEYFELYWGYESYTSSNVVLVEEIYDAYIYDIGNTDISQIVTDAMSLM